MVWFGALWASFPGSVGFGRCANAGFERCWESYGLLFVARVGPVWIGKYWTVAVRYAMLWSGAL